ncbi:hypothetical protein NDU88_007048 [Pleurodeles waltl]|uniref:Uncharacterized protein n=1 Tax=Pleurodeles waltl TaxID=8319 RepID=A0AAV7UMT4_PLEWA|nr:hypothetical protein NDU88_007048 [Pleurodeles waltl]
MGKDMGTPQLRKQDIIQNVIKEVEISVTKERCLGDLNIGRAFVGFSKIYTLIKDKNLFVDNATSRVPVSGFNIADSTELMAINDLAKESNEFECVTYDQTDINISTLNVMGFATNLHDISHLKSSNRFNPPLPSGNLIDTFHELVIGDIDKFRMKVPSKTTNRSNFTQQDWKDLNVLRTNTSIIIKPSDKGGNIVTMDTCEYTKEAYRQLMNIDHYDKLRTNPIIQYQVTYHEMLKEWHTKQLIDYDEFTFED